MKKNPLNLKPYYKFGFSLLQTMFYLGMLGLILAGIHQL